MRKKIPCNKILDIFITKFLHKPSFVETDIAKGWPSKIQFLQRVEIGVGGGLSWVILSF